MTLCASPRGGPTLWLQLPPSMDITKQCAANVLIHVVCVDLADPLELSVVVLIACQWTFDTTRSARILQGY